jgi:orotate phosphoribosyltransferase
VGPEDASSVDDVVKSGTDDEVLPSAPSSVDAAARARADVTSACCFVDEEAEAEEEGAP